MNSMLHPPNAPPTFMLDPIINNNYVYVDGNDFPDEYFNLSPFNLYDF